MRENKHATILLLMKSLMDLEKTHVGPDHIKEVHDFKDFIYNYIAEGSYKLIGHSRAEQFKSYLGFDGQPYMQYKIKCTANWNLLNVLFCGIVVSNTTFLIEEPKAIWRQHMMTIGETIKEL